MSNKKNIGLVGISRRPFWDVDYESLDSESDCLFILEKVFNYGSWADYRAVFSFYGKDKIRQEIIQASYLKKDVISFLCLILNLKPTEFKCYLKTQSLPELWHS